jgi:CDP-glycerol glycerophosphotransferase (TagB/SpsB family)
LSLSRLLGRLLNEAVPKKRQAILVLYPDFESSTPVLLQGLQHRDIATVLVLSPAADRSIVPAGVKVCREGSWRYVWAMMRSQWIFFTHVHFAGLTSRRQRIINLWHGMPIKAIQLLDGGSEAVPADLTIASGSVFVPLLAAAFGVPAASVRVLPHPRHEALVSGSKDTLRRLGIEPANYRSIIAWMPTFRGRHDTNDDTALSSGLLLNDQLLQQLSQLLIRHNSLLLLRRHPYEAGNAPVSAPHVHELLDEQLRSTGVGTYDVLAGCDALISDISSVWIDYLYRDKPVLIYFPDRGAYEGERKLLLNPFDDWSPSPVIESPAALLAELECLLDGQEPHSERRRAVARRMIEAPAAGSVDAILAAVEANRAANRVSAQQR